MIGFNKPYLTGQEVEYIQDAHNRSQLSGDGHYTKLCSEWLQENTGSHRAYLTHSCTAALEMSAILANIQPGDEIIMPSYTFVSSANPFVLRGGIPVFVDIRKDTLNINENLIPKAITKKTKAIVVVHYAGISCEMDAIMDIARKHNILVIEDAAQGILSNYKGSPLGSIGDLGCYSFHETKNIISGEGGALLVNNPELSDRAAIIREKGTNRDQFLNGKVDKYSWVDIGSSYLPGEIIAAFLWAQLQQGENITFRRKELWNSYDHFFSQMHENKFLAKPIIPKGCSGNGHMYFLILNDSLDRNVFIKKMKKAGVDCVFHYVPLHSSPAGKQYGRVCGSMEVTEYVSKQLVRLPLWLGMDIKKIQDRIQLVIRND